MASFQRFFSVAYENLNFPLCKMPWNIINLRLVPGYFRDFFDMSGLKKCDSSARTPNERKNQLCSVFKESKKFDITSRKSSNRCSFILGHLFRLISILFIIFYNRVSTLLSKLSHEPNDRILIDEYDDIEILRACDSSDEESEENDSALNDVPKREDDIELEQQNNPELNPVVWGGLILDDVSDEEDLPEEEEEGTPQGQGDIPQGQGGILQGQGGILQGQGGILQGQGGILQGQGGILQGQGGILQGQEGILQGQGGILQGQEGILQGQGGILQGQGGILQGQGGILQGQGGILQGQGGILQGQGGILQGQEGILQGQEGILQGQEGILQGQEGILQGQGGILQGQGGILQEMDDVFEEDMDQENELPEEEDLPPSHELCSDPGESDSTGSFELSSDTGELNSPPPGEPQDEEDSQDSITLEPVPKKRKQE